MSCAGFLQFGQCINDRKWHVQREGEGREEQLWEVENIANLKNLGIFLLLFLFTAISPIPRIIPGT